MLRKTGYEQKNSIVLESAVGDGLLNRKLQLSTVTSCCSWRHAQRTLSHTVVL